MKSAATILLAILLTDWMLITASASSDFDKLIERLEILSLDDLLPFKLKVNVIEELKKTPTDFTKLYVKHYSKLKRTKETHPPIVALRQTIEKTFEDYKEKAETSVQMLREIQEVDPIGFIVYFTEKLREQKSSDEMHASIMEFYATMYDRLVLFNSKEDISFIEVFPSNQDGKLHDIPATVREEIASENTVLSHESINYFIDIVKKEKPNYHMYYDYDFQMRNFTPHQSNTDDVQILYGGAGGGDNIGHWKCIQYKTHSKVVKVFDSLYRQSVYNDQLGIIEALYPLKEGDINFIPPKYRQTDPTSCGIHSIFYATTLLLGKRPTKAKIKLNKVYGDQSLYMRLHVLKMFANRKLALFDLERTYG